MVTHMTFNLHVLAAQLHCPGHQSGGGTSAGDAWPLGDPNGVHLEGDRLLNDKERVHNKVGAQ